MGTEDSDSEEYALLNGDEDDVTAAETATHGTCIRCILKIFLSTCLLYVAWYLTCRN
jgi:hypothetical protein